MERTPISNESGVDCVPHLRHEGRNPPRGGGAAPQGLNPILRAQTSILNSGTETVLGAILPRGTVLSRLTCSGIFIKILGGKSGYSCTRCLPVKSRTEFQSIRDWTGPARLCWRNFGGRGGLAAKRGPAMMRRPRMVTVMAVTIRDGRDGHPPGLPSRV